LLPLEIDPANFLTVATNPATLANPTVLPAITTPPTAPVPPSNPGMPGTPPLVNALVAKLANFLAVSF